MIKYDDRIRNKWEGKTNNTNPRINNSNTQSTTASIHNGNSSIDINNNNNNNNNNNSERSAIDGASANSISAPPNHINDALTHDTADNGQEGILIDAIAKDRNEEIKAERYFRIKEENARLTRDQRITAAQFSQPFSNSTWGVEGEGRSRGSRRSGSRATQSISNNNVYDPHPSRNASSPQRPPPVRPNNAHSPPKGTPGRSKAIRHNDEGSSFTSTSSTNNYNRYPGGHQQQQQHQSIHPSMPWYHQPCPPMYGHHNMRPSFHPHPSMQMNYNYAQSSGINYPHPSQHPLPTHPPLPHHPHQQQHSSRHPPPIHYPANHSRPTQNNARVSNTTNTSVSINNGISLDRSNGNSNRSAATQQNQTRGTCRNRLTSDQIRSELPQSMVMNGDFVLRDLKAVFGGNDTGYLRPFNAAEEDALYNSINGMVTTHIPICGSKPRFLNPGQKPDRKRSSRSFGSDKFIFENLVTLYCRHGGWKGGCGVESQVWRFQYGNDNDPDKTTGLLYYEKVNTNNNRPIEHDQHLHIPSASTDEYTLSTQQKEYILAFSRKVVGEMDIGKRRDVMQAMEMDKSIILTQAQEQNSEEFLARITSFIKHKKKSNCSGQKFFREVGSKDDTTGEELYHILNHLMTAEDSDERRSQFNMNDYTRYFMTADGRLVNDMIRVHSHDHDGHTWTYIAFEFLHSPDLAKLATKMYPTGLVQLEMVFLGICKGDQFQCGHCGNSDRNLKYWPMCFIIAKSENHTAAGSLLKRTLGLYQEAGGDGKSVMVDGGKALDKATRLENEARAASSSVEHVNEASSSVEQVNAGMKRVVQSHIMAASNVMAAFDGQEASDEGDDRGRENVERKVTSLLESHQLKLERCFSHITRNAGSRGGGWRGGKGSLERALITCKCPKGIRKKVRLLCSYYDICIL